MHYDAYAILKLPKTSMSKSDWLASLETFENSGWFFVYPDLKAFEKNTPPKHVLEELKKVDFDEETMFVVEYLDPKIGHSSLRESLRKESLGYIEDVWL